MSSRMTVAVALLTIGLAVAALAGIPALVENRNIGDVVVVCGLAVALAGFVVGLTGIPAQRQAKQQVLRDRRADIEALLIKRKRLNDHRSNTRAQMQRIDSAIRLRETIAVSGVHEEVAQRRSLEIELINITAELEMNRNDLARLGIDPELQVL